MTLKSRAFQRSMGFSLFFFLDFLVFSRKRAEYGFGESGFKKRGKRGGIMGKKGGKRGKEGGNKGGNKVF